MHSSNIEICIIDTPENKFETILLILVSIGFSFLFYWVGMSDDNIAYAIEQIHFYNPTIFANNICVQGIDYSPKLLANIVVCVLMNFTQASWSNIANVIIIINYILYGLTAMNVARRISQRNKLLFCILIIYCCHTSAMGTLGFGLWGAWDIFLGTGIASSLLGISWIIGEKKNWNVAWCCVALAALMHVHEGMWGGCILGVIWIALCAYNRKIAWHELKCLPIFITAMLIVALPNILYAVSVDNDTFVDYYTWGATYQHLSPTTWGKKSVLICFGLVALPNFFILLDTINKHNAIMSEDTYICGASVALWLFLFFLEIFVTSVSPNATIVSMYVTKCFKYVTFIALLYILKHADLYMGNNEYISALLCLWIVILGQPYYRLTIILVFLLAILRVLSLERFLWKDEFNVSQIGDCMVWIAAFGLLMTLYNGMPVLFLCFGLLLTARFVCPYFARCTKSIQYALCAGGFVVLLLFMNGKIIQIGDNGIRYISGETCLINRVGTDMYQLAKNFRSKTSADESFLADPYNIDSGRIQLVSERNCYVVRKNLPTSAPAVIEWYERIKQVEGIAKMNGDEIAQLMRETGCNYVLLSPEQYDAADNSEQLELFIKSDAAAFYTLKNVVHGE